MRNRTNKIYTFYSNGRLLRMTANELKKHYPNQADFDRIQKYSALVDAKSGQLTDLPLEEIEQALNSKKICTKNHFYRPKKTKDRVAHLRRLHLAHLNAAHNEQPLASAVNGGQNNTNLTVAAKKAEANKAASLTESVTEEESDSDNSCEQPNIVLHHNAQKTNALGHPIHLLKPRTASAYIYFRGDKLIYIQDKNLKTPHAKKRVKFSSALVYTDNGQYITCTNENQIRQAFANNEIMTKNNYDKLKREHHIPSRDNSTTNRTTRSMKKKIIISAQPGLFSSAPITRRSKVSQLQQEELYHRSAAKK